MIPRTLLDLPIRRKLVILSVLTCTLSLLLACIGFVVYEFTQFRQRSIDQLDTLAEVIGTATGPALLFQDRSSAQDALASLRVQSSVKGACVYGKDGLQFAVYPPQAASHLPKTSWAVGDYFGAKSVEVVRAIGSSGERLGTIYIQADNFALYDNLKRYLVIVFFVFVAASLVCFLVASGLEGVISKPILQLASVARKVCVGSDYSVRAVKQASDEVGDLIDAFNDMLAEIQQRSADLESHRNQLETEVSARTSELQKVNVDLTAAKERAEEAARLKSEFIANMSHEIRTPMNGILGMTQLAMDTELSSQQRELLTDVEHSAKSLLLIINDILDFSKIEAGRLELDPTPFRLRELVDDVLRLLALKAHEKGLELICDIAPEVEDCLIGDSNRIRQILINLVGNAIKFTETGEVSLSVKSLASEGRSHSLAFQISDTGIGIAQEKQGVIFDAFAQADGSTTRKYGGTGLGLAICSKLVTLMGGDLRLESTLGRGSNFTFTVELQSASETPLASPHWEPFASGKRTLLIEENEHSRQLLVRMLNQLGLETVTASSVASALHCAEQSAFDLVLLDYRLGLEVSDQVVRDVRSVSTPPPAFVALSDSQSHAEVLRRTKALDIASCLLKPVSEAKLMSAVRHAVLDCGRDQQTSGVPSPGLARAATPLSVLLAEDNPVNQRLACAILGRLGHSVRVAANGKEAVSAFRPNLFDVIFMDVQMPEMGGFEATGLIRALEKDSGVRTPIIALTAFAMKADRDRCHEAGMDDYLSKPIDAHLLADKLANITARQHPIPTTA